jgi:hypothetical protein
MERDKIVFRAKQYDEFRATPLGAAFDVFDRAHGEAWRRDTELGLSDEGYKDKPAKLAWERERAAREALLAIMFPLAGIKGEL